jgi:hypothetical protein
LSAEQLGLQRKNINNTSKQESNTEEHIPACWVKLSTGSPYFLYLSFTAQ